MSFLKKWMQFFERKILAFSNIFFHLIRLFLTFKKPKKTFHYSSYKINFLSRAEIKSLSIIKQQEKKKSQLCCLWHVYKPTDVKYFLAFVREFSTIDHFVTFNIESCGREFLDHLVDLKSIPQLSLYPVLNRGRDFKMVTEFFDRVSQNEYRYLCKLHFKERDQISQKHMSVNKSLSLIRRHIEYMQVIASQNKHSMTFYGFQDSIINQDLNLGKNKPWLQILCKRAGLSYEDLINSQFISGGMFVVSEPKQFLSLSRLIKDKDFEKELSKKLDGLLCHAMERFASFYAISQHYKIAELPSFPTYLINKYFYLKR